MKKIWLLGLAAAVLAGSFLAAGLYRKEPAFSAGKEQEPEFVLTYAKNQPPYYPTTQAAIRFAQLVQEETNGRIRIKTFMEGSLGTET